MSPEELQHKVSRMIKNCYDTGMELDEVLVEIENFITSLET